MNKRMTADYRGLVLLSLFVLGAVVALTILPYKFQSEAGGGKSGAWRTESQEPGLDNYDVRQDKSDEAVQYITNARQSSGRSVELIDTTRKNFTRGEAQLRLTVPHLKVEYNEDSHTPEVIAPDINRDLYGKLAGPSGIKNAEVLRNFVGQNSELIGVNRVQADQLKVTADYTNPDGNLSYAHLEQFINDVPVFRGEIKAGFNKRGEMFRVINNLAPGLSYDSLSADFGDPAGAVRAAFTKVSRRMTADDTTRNDALSNDQKVVFGNGDWATFAEKMYFPTEPGVVVPAWRVGIFQPVNAYYVIVDARTGTMLWRKNTTNDQAQSATYDVYLAPTSFLGVAGNPAPMSPSSIDPTAGTQGTIGTRSNSTLVGNEPPYTFNNLGWMTDNVNGGNGFTDGNNVEAGVDLGGTNGVDAPVPGVSRVFSSAWNPPPGSPPPGDAPSVAASRNGAVIQMFYVMNRYHDELYLMGFTEPARNFQNDNFSRGGVAVDRVSAEGQDSSGTNNANFNTMADGIRGRMQMFLWTGPSPQRDGTGDAEVIIHEVTHGTSNRLHNNANGLTTNMSGAMGEGWGDFMGHAMLSRPSEPLDSTNTTGGYALLQGFGVVGTANYYYGIRRFPKARMSFTGGPQNRPHNPMTFADIDQTKINVSNGAYTAMAGPHISTSADQVHAAGEVWSSALWEVRCLMVGRLGWATGNRKVMQLVIDGMKLNPVGPTFLQSRDSIIAAAAASAIAPEASADVADVREGFRIRGMGFSASIQVAGTGGGTARVTEAFDVPNALITDPFAVSDSTGDNDGFPEPGETVLLSVPITNTSGSTINNVVGSVTGGGSANYGNIADGQTVTRQISYPIPGGAPCGSMHQVTLTGTSAVGALVPQTRSFRLGVPVGGAPVTFTSSTLINVPQGQPTTTSGVGGPYPSSITVSGLTGNKAVKLELTGFSHQFTDDVDILLVGPAGQKFIIMSDAAGNTRTNLGPHTLVFSDGATGTIADSGPLAAGEYKPVNYEAGADAFASPAPVGPYSSPAPIGTATFASVFGTSGAALNGTWSLYTVDDAGTDVGTIQGWKLTFEANDFNCSVGPVVANSDARADFDGDNKSDLSVFRPSDGNWYLNRSTDGFAVTHWGMSGDVPVPGDYDGDDKADTVIYRASDTPGVPDFFVLRSSNGTVYGIEFGLTGDVPVPGDYTGGDIDDFAVYRPSTGVWYTYHNPPPPVPTRGAAAPEGIPIVTITFTGPGTPVGGDFDGDDITDKTMFNSGVWTIFKSTGGVSTVNWGLAGDKPVSADYDGDGKDDQAVYRAGVWYIHGSLGTDVITAWGISTDTPVPGDYDGDGKDDIAVYRDGVWYINGSVSGIQIAAFGLSTDQAIPGKYQP